MAMLNNQMVLVYMFILFPNCQPARWGSPDFNKGATPLPLLPLLLLCLLLVLLHVVLLLLRLHLACCTCCTRCHIASSECCGVCLTLNTISRAPDAVEWAWTRTHARKKKKYLHMYQYICQIECHKACQIECQNKYQIECQKECQIECHKCFQMICLKLCQNCVSGWGSLHTIGMFNRINTIWNDGPTWRICWNTGRFP